MTPSARVATWLKANEFVPGELPGSYEVAWGHSSGYGFVTLRLIPLEDAGEAFQLVLARSATKVVNIGWARSFEQLQAVSLALSGLAYDVDVIGQDAQKVSTAVIASNCDELARRVKALPGDPFASARGFGDLVDRREVLDEISRVMNGEPDRATYLAQLREDAVSRRKHPAIERDHQ